MLCFLRHCTYGYTNTTLYFKVETIEIALCSVHVRMYRLVSALYKELLFVCVCKYARECECCLFCARGRCAFVFACIGLLLAIAYDSFLIHSCQK